MAVNKNFVVKNGLEVSTDLIIADAARNKVGIGSTTPRVELDVRGGIAATDLNLSGVGTIVTLQSTTGTITNLISSNLTAGAVQATHITASGVTTAATLNVTNTGTIAVGIITNLRGTNLNYSGISTLGVTTISDLTSQQLNVSGVSTFTSLRSTNINVSGIVTAPSFVGNVTGTATTAATVDVVNTNGLTTIYYPTFVENRTDGQIVRADVDLTYRTDDNILTVPKISSTEVTATNVTLQQLNVSGISTLGNVKIVSGIITAASGIVTYYGDGSNLTGLSGNPPLQTVLNTGNTSTVGMSISGISTLTSLTGTNLNYSGISTLTSLTGTNLNYSGVGTITNIRGTSSNITGVSTAQDFDALSDINYKTDILTIDDSLNKIDKLRGVKFNWKESGLPSYGVIAQELQEVLPELVHGNNPKTVNYNGIIGVLIEAIKDLKVEVEELKKNLL